MIGTSTITLWLRGSGEHLRLRVANAPDPSTAPIHAGTSRRSGRNARTCASTSAAVRRGLWCGLLERSTKSASPSLRPGQPLVGRRS